MLKLSTTQRAAVLRCLIEGNSIRSTVRITGVAKNTITKLLVEAGEACDAYQDKHLRNLPCKRIQLDEIWSFVGCKERTKHHAKRSHPGDIWTWTSICADTKLIPAWRLGDRSRHTGSDFCADLAERIKGRVQISSDGHTGYFTAVAANLGEHDYGQIVKYYGKDNQGREVCLGARKEPVFGSPHHDHISTSFIERSNLTLRMGNRRFTRCTNAYSKKMENHCHMLAISFMAYNFTRRHHTIKQTPAQAAGVADHQWTLEEVIAMIDEHTAQKEREAFEAAFVAKFEAAEFS